MLDEEVDEMRRAAVSLAQAENEYRKGKAQAWVKCPPADRETWTAARREAWVNAECADLRQSRDIEEGMAKAAYQAVQARRTQLSSLQTLLNAHQQELKFTMAGQS